MKSCHTVLQPHKEGRLSQMTKHVSGQCSIWLLAIYGMLVYTIPDAIKPMGAHIVPKLTFAASNAHNCSHLFCRFVIGGVLRLVVDHISARKPPSDHCLCWRINLPVSICVLPSSIHQLHHVTLCLFGFLTWLCPFTIAKELVHATRMSTTWD